MSYRQGRINRIIRAGDTSNSFGGPRRIPLKGTRRYLTPAGGEHGPKSDGESSRAIRVDASGQDISPPTAEVAAASEGRIRVRDHGIYARRQRRRVSTRQITSQTVTLYICTYPHRAFIIHS